MLISIPFGENDALHIVRNDGKRTMFGLTQNALFGMTSISHCNEVDDWFPFLGMIKLNNNRTSTY